MTIPQWILELKQHDELLLYFPFTGNSAWAEFLSNNAFLGEIEVQYIWKNKVKHDTLSYDNYTLDCSSYENWYAYPVNKNESDCSGNQNL